MRFLISRLSSLGDVVCTLPAAVALRRIYPNAEITWAVDPRFADVVRCCTAVDHVLPTKPKFKKGSLPVFAEAFDAAFDLQGLLKSAIVVERAQAGIKLGYHWQREGSRLYSAPVRPDPTSLHVVDQYVDVVRAFGASMERAEFDLKPSPEALSSVQQRLAELGVTGPFVLLNAGAGWATKRYPAASFALVIQAIGAEGLTPVLIGGADAPAREAAEAVVAACSHPPVSLLGQTSIPELIAAISLAKAHVGGDTGSTHIAAALGTPAIGLYSITRPERCCPYGQRSRTLYDPYGLDRIPPEAVSALVRKAAQA